VPRRLTSQATTLEGATALMTADAVGGVWRYALDLAGGLAGAGVSTVLATLGPRPSAAERAAALAIPRLRLVETDLSLDWTARDAAEVRASGRAVAALAGETGADLVHLNAPALAAGGRFPVPTLGVCHSCTATWWEAVEGGPLPPDFLWRKALVGEGLAAVDARLAPSRAFAAMTQAAYGLAAPPLVVRNGRRAPAAPPAGPPAPHAFSAGRLWDRAKNAVALERAARGSAIAFRAAGPLEGPNGERVALEAVRALGPLDAEGMAAELAARPVFVSPALYEPFGLAVLEAAQAGCALVLSDIPTFRELWDGAALFVPAEDGAAIAGAVERLVGDEALRARLGAAAAARARPMGVEAMVEGTLAVYAGLLDPCSRRPDRVTRRRESGVSPLASGDHCETQVRGEAPAAHMGSDAARLHSRGEAAPHPSGFACHPPRSGEGKREPRARPFPPPQAGEGAPRSGDGGGAASAAKASDCRLAYVSQHVPLWGEEGENGVGVPHTPSEGAA